MPTTLSPASLMVQTPALLEAQEEAPTQAPVLSGDSDATSQSGKEGFLAALRALLEWNLGGAGVQGECPNPPAHGARERFGAEDLPKGLMKLIQPAAETGADPSSAAADEEGSADSSPLAGGGCVGNGIPNLLWSAMLLGGFGAQAEAGEEVGNGRWALPQILSAMRAGTGREGSTEGVSALAEAKMPSGLGSPTEPGASAQVAGEVEGQGSQVPLLPTNEMKPTDVIGRSLVETKSADLPRALFPDAKAANSDAAPKNDAIREGGAHSASQRAARGESAPKEGGPSFSLDFGEVSLPEGGRAADVAVKENGSPATLRASSPDPGEGNGPAVRAPECSVSGAGPGITAVQGVDQEGKTETGIKTATAGKLLDIEAIYSEVQASSGDSDGGAESGSRRESARGEDGFGIPRNDTSETLSGANSLKRGGETFSKALHPEVVDRIVERAVLSFREGQREIRIDLKPEFLGQVRLHISTDHQQVMVRMVAENSAAKEIIESNIHQLRAALQNQGLEIGKFDISLAHDSGQQGAGYGQHPAPGGAVSVAGEETQRYLSEDKDTRTYTGAGEHPADSVDFFA